MQIELVKAIFTSNKNLPPELKPYQILYWFESSRVPVEGEIIYLANPDQAQRMEDAYNASV